MSTANVFLRRIDRTETTWDVVLQIHADGQPGATETTVAFSLGLTAAIEALRAVKTAYLKGYEAALEEQLEALHAVRMGLLRDPDSTIKQEANEKEPAG